MITVQNSNLSCSGTLLACLCLTTPVFGVTDAGVVLGTPSVSSNRVQFTLSCEPEIPYVIQSTTDFQNWSPVLTNSDPEVLRSFDLESTNAQAFYRVSRRPLSLFGSAVVALGVIDLNGYNIASDSFDSADPNHSINGLYPFGQTNMIKSNGHIMAGLMMVDSVGVGNARIEGKVRTGSDGTITLGTNGYATGGIQHNFNTAFPNATLPVATWLPVPLRALIVDGQSYYGSAILSNGDYIWPCGTFAINYTNLYVASNVTCRLWIVCGANLNKIHIDDGAIVRMYMQGGWFNIAGDGIVNDNGFSGSFYYYGLPSNTNVQIAANSHFTGAIYAPQADLTLGGGGGDVYEFIGAAVTKSVRFDGHFNFHFDEHLKRIGPFR